MRDASRQLISSPIPLERHTKFEDPSALRLVSVALQLGVALDAFASQMRRRCRMEDIGLVLLDLRDGAASIESFNYFLESLAPQIVNEIAPLTVGPTGDHVISIRNPSISPPILRTRRAS